MSGATMNFRAQTMPWIAICVFAIGSVMPSAAAAKSLLVRLRYVETHDRVLPFAEQTTTNVAVEAHISQNGAIQSKEARASGKYSRDYDKQLTLGANQGQEWRVAGKNRLINIVDYISYRRAILLTVSESACTAEVNYQLKPGFSDYRYHRLANGEPAVARSVVASELNCSVSEAD
jgi:hypothetical protein